MDSERLKRIASGCLVLIVCFFAFLGLDNWFGSGPAIREVKESISSVDSKQFKNASYNDSRIEKLEREVKDLLRQALPEHCRSRLSVLWRDRPSDRRRSRGQILGYCGA
jgi:hypothetical protein